MASHGDIFVKYVSDLERIFVEMRRNLSNMSNMCRTFVKYLSDVLKMFRIFVESLANMENKRP